MCELQADVARDEWGAAAGERQARDGRRGQINVLSRLAVSALVVHLDRALIRIGHLLYQAIPSAALAHLHAPLGDLACFSIITCQLGC